MVLNLKVQKIFVLKGITHWVKITMSSDFNSISPLCRRHLPDFHRRHPPATCSSHGRAASCHPLPPADLPLSVAPPVGVPHLLPLAGPCHGRREPGSSFIVVADAALLLVYLPLRSPPGIGEEKKRRQGRRSTAPIRSLPFPSLPWERERR